MRPEYLVALGDRLDEREMENLEEFGLKYVAGKLPAWLYRLWLSTQTVPMRPAILREYQGKMQPRAAVDQVQGVQEGGRPTTKHTTRLDLGWRDGGRGVP